MATHSPGSLRRSDAYARAMEHACDSCGDRDLNLSGVRRIYVEYREPDPDPIVTEVPEEEQWCPACRATYPHLPLA